MNKFLLIFAVLIQAYFFSQTYHIKPNLEIVPAPPTEEEMAALSFGDKQLYFRVQTLNLQMFGDTFGRTTPLKDYNLPKLKKWFDKMDTLDWESNSLPSMAAYYFSRSQNPKSITPMVDYLEEHAGKGPDKKWWWLSQAIYLANAVLDDKPRALRLAQKLRAVKGEIPLWARQMEVFMREDLGEKDKAEEIMCQVIRESNNLKGAADFEIKFMYNFFEERLNKPLKNKSMDEVARMCAPYYKD